MMLTNELKGRMVAAGYSQKGLAEAMTAAGSKISENTLSKKVNGRVPFDTVEIDCICNLLGIVGNDEKAYIFLTSSSH